MNYKILSIISCLEYLCTTNMASGCLKKATGLTGLAVAKTPHHTLEVLYSKIIRALERMPENAAYRKYTHQTVCDRLNIVKAEADPQRIEERINCGQVEELIIQAEKELRLARKMISWRPWEPLVAKPPPTQWQWPVKTK